MLNLGGFGSILGLFWHMGWMIAENLQKLNENTVFFVFWGARKGGSSTFLAMLAPRWHFSGILRALVGHVGAKMANKIGKMANMRGKMGARRRKCPHN